MNKEIAKQVESVGDFLNGMRKIQWTNFILVITTLDAGC